MKTKMKTEKSKTEEIPQSGTLVVTWFIIPYGETARNTDGIGCNQRENVNLEEKIDWLITIRSESRNGLEKKTD